MEFDSSGVGRRADVSSGCIEQSEAPGKVQPRWRLPTGVRIGGAQAGGALHMRMKLGVGKGRAEATASHRIDTILFTRASLNDRRPTPGRSLTRNKLQLPIVVLSALPLRPLPWPFRDCTTPEAHRQLLPSIVLSAYLPDCASSARAATLSWACLVHGLAERQLHPAIAQHLLLRPV
jgi:hypothetical protein